MEKKKVLKNKDKNYIKLLATNLANKIMIK